MLRTVSGLKGSAIQARDGAIGSIDDVLFDDRAFAVRWFVIDTGTWLPGRHVLLPPSQVGPSTTVPSAFPVDLTREQVKGSPGVETDQPVSRQMESDIHGYYGWAPYWAGPVAYAPVRGGMGADTEGNIPLPGSAPPPAATPSPVPPDERRAETGDPHLRSAREITGYHVKASDGEIGHVEDLLVDDESWVLRYLIVDTRNWWPGKQVLVAPEWATSFRWAQQEVDIDLTRAEIKGGQEYDPVRTLTRADEELLYGHYRRTPYWI